MTTYLLHSGQLSAERLLRRVQRLVGVTELRSAAEDDVVIRFGNGVDPDVGGYVVNRRDAVLQADSRKTMLRALRRAGVRCPRLAGGEDAREERAQLIRHYRVLVFNLRPIACFRTDGKTVWLSKRINQVQDTFNEVSLDADEEATKVCLLAVRAVHALGLEFALVSLGINPASLPLVVDVNPDPVLKGRVLDMVAQGVEAFLSAEDEWRGRGVPDLLMGTDLEFMLRGRQGKMVLASNYFPEKGRVGCDDRSLAGNRGRRPLAELRPKPAETPEELLQNIESALKRAVELAPGPYPQWIAGSAPFPNFPVGGHIHLSGVPYTGRLVSLLDVYVGLPLMLIEDPETASKRRPKYGFLGDIRHKPHGGFEYRTPASFLVDPGIALAALALAYAVVRHYRELPYLPLHRPDYQRAFYRSDRDYLLEFADQAFAALSHTATFAQYREPLAAVWDMIRQDEVWDESVDVRRAWGVLWDSRKAIKSRTSRTHAMAMQ